MFKHLKDFLDFRLLSLSGGVLTPGSILVAVAIALLAVAVASVVGRWLRRALDARGLPVGTQFEIGRAHV